MFRSIELSNNMTTVDELLTFAPDIPKLINKYQFDVLIEETTPPEEESYILPVLERQGCFWVIYTDGKSLTTFSGRFGTKTPVVSSISLIAQNKNLKKHCWLALRRRYRRKIGMGYTILVAKSEISSLDSYINALVAMSDIGQL